MKLTIAFLQLLPAGSLEENLDKGIKACLQAKEKGADIALFPEMWSCGYSFPHEKESLRERAAPCDGFFVRRFSEMAAELDMAIAITFLERHEPKPRNTVCLFDRHGKLLYRYAKVHICDFGEADDESVLDAGDSFFVADLDTKDGIVRVGSMICYDREFPESARILMLKGAELLLVPNACPMELNRLAQLRGRAYENMLAIATCNYPSPHPDCNVIRLRIRTATAVPPCSTAWSISRSFPLRGTPACLRRGRERACTRPSWTWTCCGSTAAVKSGA